MLLLYRKIGLKSNKKNRGYPQLKRVRGPSQTSVLTGKNPTSPPVQPDIPARLKCLVERDGHLGDRTVPTTIRIRILLRRPPHPPETNETKPPPYGPYGAEKRHKDHHHSKHSCHSHWSLLRSGPKSKDLLFDVNIISYYLFFVQPLGDFPTIKQNYETRSRNLYICVYIKKLRRCGFPQVGTFYYLY